MIQKIVVVLSLMIVVGGTLTGIMTYANMGFTATFFSDWLTAFGFTAVIMMPAGILLTMVVGRLINAVIPDAAQTTHNIAVGIVYGIGYGGHHCGQ